MKFVQRLSLTLSLGLVVASASAQTLKPVSTVEGISEYRLPNGLQVLLAPDASKPTTTVNVTYKVGSKHENYGETGMAHLLEHLIFKGSPKYQDPWKEFTARGFRANGTTWLDRTNYFASFAANEANLKWYLNWQADAMVNSYIAKRHLDTEMTVVRNEMEMGENSPQNNTFEATLGTMYQWHNYGKSTIGARADVENVDIGRLQAFYRTYYQPDNATLIVSGKFEPSKVLAWVQESFGKIQRPKRALTKLYTIDPVQDGERSTTIRRIGGTPQTLVGYHMPAGPHPDYAAVAVLDVILSDTPSGRLHKRLIEETKLAAQISGESAAMAEPGFGLYGAVAAPGVSLDDLNRELLATLEGFASKPISAEELKRAQTIWLNGWDKQFTNPEAIGVGLSESISQGDWRLYFLLRDRVKALKLEDVQRVATERFLPANRTLTQYIPTEKPQRAPKPAFVNLEAELQTFKPQAAAAVVAEFDASPANIDKATASSRLPNGMQVALLSKPTRGEAVHGTLTLRLGDERSLQGQAQVGSVLAGMLSKGTQRLDRQQLSDALEAAKVQWQVNGGAEGVTVSFNTKREHVAQAIALLTEMLRHPRLETAGLEEIRAQTLTGIAAQKDDPQGVAGNALSRATSSYEAGHVRYAQTFAELEAATKAVTLEQVKAFHAKFYGAQNGQVALVGDFDATAAQAAIKQHLGEWKAQAAYERIASRDFSGKPGQRQLLATPEKQNAMMLGAQALPINDDDADVPALMLGTHIIGSGPGSRLWGRIREKEGLSYGIGTNLSLNSRDKASALIVYGIFAPQNRDKVEVALHEELTRVLRDGVSAPELEQAKQALHNEIKLSLAQDRGLAGRLANNLDLNRKVERTQRIMDALQKQSLEQVNAALRKHLNLDKAQFFFAGDFK